MFSDHVRTGIDGGTISLQIGFALSIRLKNWIENFTGAERAVFKALAARYFVHFFVFVFLLARQIFVSSKNGISGFDLLLQCFAIKIGAS